MAEVKSISNQAELDEFMKVNDGKLVVLDFYATWCGPCKMIAPKIAEMAKQLDTVAFAKIDVDESEDLAQEYGISAMPTFLFYKDGKKIDEMMGANKDKLVELIDKHK